ncbi:MAG TPA: hypothetical protein VMP68_22700, partial [Candidatus Eisenbacteria bacterium]|nr:hypothetical protein [Candidatus Eisenbacteria bacterium]
TRAKCLNMVWLVRQIEPLAESIPVQLAFVNLSWFYVESFLSEKAKQVCSLVVFTHSYTLIP